MFSMDNRSLSYFIFLGTLYGFFMLYFYLFILVHKGICLCLHFSSKKVFILAYKTKNNIFKSKERRGKGKKRK